MFAPLRTLGVPEPVIDVFEPFFKVIVELGYDRSIPPWEPTPARLIPPLNPATVAGDLVDAVGEGITNAAALIGAPNAARGHPRRSRGTSAHGRWRAGDDQGPAQRGHRYGEVGHRRRAHDRAVRPQ